MLSIITPTYNRAELLKKCYASLLQQTCKDFEWIVVDDGSADNTAEVVKGFDAEKFPIVYVSKENGGKHTALNASHPYVNGEYVLILDSDDTLTATAVEQVKNAWQRFSENENIGTVIFLKGSSENMPFCRVDDEDELKPVNSMTCKRICFQSSDCCEVIRAELFKQYPFPEFEGEKFISEGVLWHRVSFTHKCVYVNKVIYLADYLEGGLTKQGRAMRIRCPLGGMFNSDLLMDRSNSVKSRIKSGLLYTCYGFFAKMKPKHMAKKCRAKLLMWLCLPFGWALYKYWKKKYT